MDVVFLRNSERQSFLNCRLAWYWEWVEKRKPRGTKPALLFGDLVHQAFERYYIPGRDRGPHPRKTFKKLYDKLTLKQGYSFGMKVKGREDDDEVTWANARELGVAMLNGYVDEYGPEEWMDIIVPEMPFRVNLYRPDNGKYIVTAVGKLDAVYRDFSKKHKPLAVLDHKTAASIQEAYLELDEQGGTYFSLAPIFLRSEGLLGEKEQLRYILFSFLRKAFPDDRPYKMNYGKRVYLNKDGTPSKRQPPPYFLRKEVIKSEESTLELLSRIRNQAWEMKLARKGKLPIYKHPQKSCPAQCGFYDACVLHEVGSDWEELLELTTTTWEPHADHELIKKE